jgi:hypothetical protein
MIKWFRSRRHLKKFFTGAIDHAPWIILQAFTGAGVITPVSGRPCVNTSMLMIAISISAKMRIEDDDDSSLYEPIRVS